jgi:hypothetical protein
MSTNISVIRPPRVNEIWKFMDYLGALKVRMSFGRNSYSVKPGLYAFQKPDQESDVFVTANYKLSFDILRKELAGLNAWILVLDTKGINVWCAAGKGTFGTNELIRQIKNADLEKVINHKRLIVPQLGAPGINAQQVKSVTGFAVKFGPVRASDIKEYIGSRYKKTEQMSTVTFNAIDRLKIVPVEVMVSLRKFVLIAVTFFIISGLSSKGYSIDNSLTIGLKAVGILFIAYLGGSAITPFLLPWVPFRSFSAKGLIVGTLLLGTILIVFPFNSNMSLSISLFFIGIAISSFLAMNFTGASTYTSLSGVKKEMRLFVPIQAVAASIGTIIFILSRFINL